MKTVIAVFYIFFLLVVLNAQNRTGSDLDYSQVRFVMGTETDPGVWTFDVTVEHNDQGWNHYADRWEILDADTGESLGLRILRHPHDNEQPFTRSLSGIVIPESVHTVKVRSRCTKHDWGNEIQVSLDGTSNGSNILKPLVSE